MSESLYDHKVEERIAELEMMRHKLAQMEVESEMSMPQYLEEDLYIIYRSGYVGIDQLPENELRERYQDLEDSLK